MELFNFIMYIYIILLWQCTQNIVDTFFVFLFKFCVGWSTALTELVPYDAGNYINRGINTNVIKIAFGSNNTLLQDFC